MSDFFSSDVVCARVVAGDIDICYYAVGRGAPVVLLVANRQVLSDLLDRLPRHLRVIAPTGIPVEIVATAPADELAAAWLRGFLDTLGLECVTLAADTSLASAALAYALAEPDRVTRLIFLRSAAREPNASATAIAAELPARLESEDATGIDHMVSRIVDFVGGESGAAEPNDADDRPHDTDPEC
jgi:pimeloyl-ACP methyl ester carboxylesterase